MEAAPKYNYDSLGESGPGKKKSAEVMPTPERPLPPAPAERAPDPVERRPETDPFDRLSLTAEADEAPSIDTAEMRIRDLFAQQERTKDKKDKAADKLPGALSDREDTPAAEDHDSDSSDRKAASAEDHRRDSKDAATDTAESRATQDETDDEPPSTTGDALKSAERTSQDSDKTADSIEQTEPSAAADNGEAAADLSESERSLGELTPDENRQASEYLATEAAKEAHAELGEHEPDDPAAAAAAAAEAYNEGIKDGRTPEESYAHVAGVIEASADETAAAELPDGGEASSEADDVLQAAVQAEPAEAAAPEAAADPEQDPTDETEPAMAADTAEPASPIVPELALNANESIIGAPDNEPGPEAAAEPALTDEELAAEAAEITGPDDETEAAARSETATEPLSGTGEAPDPALDNAERAGSTDSGDTNGTDPPAGSSRPGMASGAGGSGGGPRDPGDPASGFAAGSGNFGRRRANGLNPPDMISKYDAMYYERRAAGRGLLVGGILGYFWGRRRGRIKTEKKLLPIQKGLQKQVEQLHDQMAARERDVRKLALERALSDKFRDAAQRRELTRALQSAGRPAGSVRPETAARAAAGVEAIAAVTAALAGSPEAGRAARPLSSQARLGRLVVEQPRTPAELRAEQTRLSALVAEGSLTPAQAQAAGLSAAEALRAAGNGVRAEQLDRAGRMRNAEPVGLIPGERPSGLERSAETAAGLTDARTVQLLGANRSVEQLSHQELLAVAGRIEIDGVPVSRMYESSALDEKGLRRVVLEQLRGGNAKQALAREMVERELRFERDPRARGAAGGAVSGGGAAGGGASPSIGGVLSGTAGGAGLTSQERSQIAWQQREEAHREQQRKRTLNTSVGTILAVLTGIVFYLIVFR